MKLSVVIPVINQHQVTKRCLELLNQYRHAEPEIILIDNGSLPEYEDAVHNEENLGLVESLRQGYLYSVGEVILYMHNDVLIHESGWDTRILRAFEDDPRLGVAGFFGGRGIHADGGRMHPESNMLGKEWGSPWHHHGALQIGVHPAAVLDGLGMIFRRSMLDDCGIPECPPHHWYDRILPLFYIERGWRCATIGIRFDHGSGFTSEKGDYHRFAKDWCDTRGIPAIEGNYDLAIYNEGWKQFQRDWSPKLPLTVDGNYNYSWRS